MSRELSKRKRFAKWRIDLAIHDAIQMARKRSMGTPFEELLNAVLARGDLLKAREVGGYESWSHVNKYLRGLLALCRHRNCWRREVRDWSPDDARSPRQFGSLANYLLSLRELPTFLTRVWLDECSQEASRRQKLFKHLAMGHSIRGADTPIRLTKPMAEHFMRAPDHLTVEQAMRWSQVRGLGGDRTLAEVVLESPIAGQFRNEAFWRRVIELLVAERRIDVEQIRVGLEFLFGQQDELAGRVADQMRPHQLRALLKQAVGLRRRRCRHTTRPPLRWDRSPIGGFRYMEPHKHKWSVRYWTIRELTEECELIEEGVALGHCVANYVFACARRRTSIWSLQVHGSLTSHRLLTIEVCPEDNKIVTALGLRNSSPKPAARRIMELWAEAKGLTIGYWV